MNSRPNLTQSLEETERTHPPVRAARNNVDRAAWRILFYARINERRAAEGKPPIGPFAR